MAKLTECPYCKADIPVGAIKCKSCGEFINLKYRIPLTRLYRGFFESTPKIYCPNCKYEGKATYRKKGSTRVTIILLFLWIIPGIIYEVWRGGLYFVCPECKNEFVNKV